MVITEVGLEAVFLNTESPSLGNDEDRLPPIGEQGHDSESRSPLCGCSGGLPAA